MSDQLDRLWAPYRMNYVRSAPAAVGCPFCAMMDPGTGAELVIARSTDCFVVLNLYPYNPGHLMILPRRHVADYEDLTAEETAQLADLTQKAIKTIRLVSNPDAFNVGMNLGDVAGGSVSAHLHQHVVPRWGGDANFMTVVGQTKTLPQLLEDTADLLKKAWDDA